MKLRNKSRSNIQRAKERKRIQCDQETEIKTEEQRPLILTRMNKMRNGREQETTLDDQNTDSNIGSAVREALETLHCTQHHSDPLKYCVHICVVYNSMTIGAKAVNCMTIEQLLVH